MGRINNSVTKRLPQLDLLRTIAILLVFLWHVSNLTSLTWIKAVGHFGWIGVDLFFVLSGYLITQILLRSFQNNQISFLKFYFRRCLRIWPAYLFMLFIFFSFPVFSPHLPPLWKFLTFTQNFGLDIHSQGTFSHAWSLCIEEQFYLVLPLAISFLYRKSNTRLSLILFWGSILAGILLRFTIWKEVIEPVYNTDLLKMSFYKWIYYPTYCRLDGLITGVAIAFTWKKLVRYANYFFIAGVVGVAIALGITRDQFSLLSSTLGFPVLNLSFGALLISALAPTGWFSKIRVPGIKWPAIFSYSFYLIHKQIIALPFGRPSNEYFFLTEMLLLSFTASGVMYFVIERPFLKLNSSLCRA